MTERETAALCAARLFQGWGHEIRKKGRSGVGYSQEGADKLTQFEKETLKEAFFFFLDIIQDKVKRSDVKPPERESIRGYRSD